MKERNGPIDFIKNLLSKGGGENKRYHYVLLVVFLGIGIMIISNVLSQDETDNSIKAMKNSNDTAEVEVFRSKDSIETKIIEEYERRYETQLKEALEGIVGVSDVTVVVNVDATEKLILEKNTTLRSQTTEEKDREGGERKVEDQSSDTQVVIIREGDKEAPIIIETKKPKIRGVLVVAKGADNIQVKKWILEAVTKLLDVPSHRVSVMPKK